MALTKIPGNLIEAGAITAASLDNDAVTTAKILDANITHAKLHATMDLTGKTVTVATAAGGTNTTAAASTAFVQQELTTLIDGAPGTLDTLNELAAAINDDANYNSTLTTALATKLPLAGGSLTGDLLMRNGGNIELGGYNSGNDKGLILSPQDGSGYWHVYNTAGGHLAFGASNTIGSSEKMRITGSGNVGIGRPDPTQLLEVHKSSGGDQTVAKISAHNYGDTGKTFIEIGTEYGDGSSRIGSFNDTGNSSVLVFDTHSATSGQFTERMRIASSGNVGIGTDNPRTTLNIGANDSGQGPILTLENTDTSITTGDVIGQIDFYANDGSSNGTGPKVNIKAVAQSSAGTVTELTFGTSPSSSATAIERMRIDASGNVGIGTNNPSSKLEVNGELEISPAEPTIHLNRGNGSYSWKIVNGGGVDHTISTFNIANNAGTAVITALDNGNVGIGNSSPPEMLTIGNTTDTYVRLQFLSSPAGGNTIHFGDGASADAYRGWINYTHSDDALALATAGAQRIKLDNAGKMTFFNSDAGTAGGIRGTRFGYSTAYRVLQIGESSGTYTVSLGVDPSGNSSGSFTGYGNELIVRNDFELISPNATNDNWHNDIIKLKDGNVGIGMSPDGASASVMEKFQVMGRAVIHNSNGNHVWSETIQGTDRGSLHLDPNSGSNDVGAAITWGASDHNNGEVADAGIYTRTDGTYGTKMYISTTDSYAHGSQTAIGIMHDGQVYQPRQSSFLAYGGSTGYNPLTYSHSVVYPNTSYNIGSDYSGSTGLYTAPYDGFYIFEASIYSTATVSNGWGQAWLTINGARGNFTDKFSNTGSNGGGTSIISTIHTVYLSSGDTAGYHPYTSTGSGIAFHTNVHHTWFRGRFIG